MHHINQTRPLGGRVGCENFGRQSHSAPTPIDWRSQLIASRYRLSLATARQVSRLHFGEAQND